MDIFYAKVPGINVFFKPHVLTLLFVLFAGSAFGVIPPYITTNTTISVSDASVGNCVVQSGVTLRIQSGAIATFNGNLTIEESAKVEVINGTIEMAPGATISIKGYSSVWGTNSYGGTFFIANMLLH